MKKTLKQIIHLVTLIENFLCSVGLVLTTFLVFAQVVNRYWLHFEIMWLSDMALYIFVFSMLMAISLTTRENGHTAVDIFGDLYFGKKPKINAFYKIVLNIISLSILISFYSPVYKFTLRAIKYPEYGTLVRWFNTSWLAETMFAKLLLCIFHISHLLIDQLLSFYQIVRSDLGGDLQ